MIIFPMNCLLIPIITFFPKPLLLTDASVSFYAQIPLLSDAPGLLSVNEFQLLQTGYPLNQNRRAALILSSRQRAIAGKLRIPYSSSSDTFTSTTKVSPQLVHT